MSQEVKSEEVVPEPSMVVEVNTSHAAQTAAGSPAGISPAGSPAESPSAARGTAVESTIQAEVGALLNVCQSSADEIYILS